jgi:hypothetical protein
MEEMQEHFGISIATIYRDAQALINAGAAQHVTGGLTAALPGDQIQTQCRFCGKTVNPRTIFLIQTRDGAQRTACCPHCGLMAINHPDVMSAMASDFLYGRMVNARQAGYLVESTVSLCCEPSVLCFSNFEEARQFQQGFGGEVCTLEQAEARLAALMALDEKKEE